MACRLIEEDRHDSIMLSQIFGLLLCCCHGGVLIQAMVERDAVWYGNRGMKEC